MMTARTLLGALFMLFLLQSLAAEEKAYINTRTLSLDVANKMAMSAVEDCRKQGYQVAVAVTDRNGIPLVQVRDPLAGHHTIEVALRKAYSAASFQSPTIELQGGRFNTLNHTQNALLIGGGVPVRVGGHVYGAIGVSGAPAKKVMGDIDDQCARAGIESIRETLEFAE